MTPELAAHIKAALLKTMKNEIVRNAAEKSVRKEAMSLWWACSLIRV